MSPRSSVAPVVASGTASVVKLLIATLAFTGAYVGVGASRYSSAQAPANTDTRTRSLFSEPAQVSTAQVSTAQVSTAQVSTAQVSTAQASTAQASTAQASTAQTPDAGRISVSALTAPRPCDKPYLIRSMIDNPRPKHAVSYSWRLQRWSVTGRSWRTYLIVNAGFAGPHQAAEWRPSVTDNPGWYRAELSVSGGTRLRSERFLVSC